MLKNFKDLQVWQKSYALVIEIYKVTTVFPKSELYGLTSQIRRAAISIPSNIAEGYSRGHRTEYIRFVSMAYGSLAELQTQLMLAKDLDYIQKEVYETIAGEYEDLERMISAMIKSLKAKQSEKAPGTLEPLTPGSL